MTLEFGNLSLGGTPFSSVSKLIRTWQTTNCGSQDPRPEGELTRWDVDFASLFPSQNAKDAAIDLAKTGVVGCLTVIGKAGTACDAWVLTQQKDGRTEVVASGSHSAKGQKWLGEILGRNDRGPSSRVRRPAQRPKGSNKTIRKGAQPA